MADAGQGERLPSFVEGLRLMTMAEYADKFSQLDMRVQLDREWRPIAEMFPKE